MAIELLCAAQLLDFRLPLKAGVGAQQAHALVRSYVAKLEQDRTLTPDIEVLTRAIRSGAFADIE